MPALGARTAQLGARSARATTLTTTHDALPPPTGRTVPLAVGATDRDSASPSAATTTPPTRRRTAAPSPLGERVKRAPSVVAIFSRLWLCLAIFSHRTQYVMLCTYLQYTCTRVSGTPQFWGTEFEHGQKVEGQKPDAFFLYHSIAVCPPSTLPNNNQPVCPNFWEGVNPCL